jgi:hypothetical protein
MSQITRSMFRSRIRGKASLLTPTCRRGTIRTQPKKPQEADTFAKDRCINGSTERTALIDVPCVSPTSAWSPARLSPRHAARCGKGMHQ